MASGNETYLLPLCEFPLLMRFIHLFCSRMGQKDVRKSCLVFPDWKDYFRRITLVPDSYYILIENITLEESL